MFRPMAEAAAKETLETRFLTWHDSAGNLHVRTDSMVLYIDKAKEELQAAAKRMRRGQALRVTGQVTYSKTLSNMVFDVDALEAL